MASPYPADAPQRLTLTHWLIVSMAAIGFAFDTYALLMLPLIARPALASLLDVDPNTNSGAEQIQTWTGYIMWGSAISGGIFGLIGGYLTDWFGRRRVLTWSILVYAFSALAAAYCRTAEALLILRCVTFIGVCVEFVAAVAWLAELFPNPHQREAVLGYTQAFASLGGLAVAGAYHLAVHFSDSLPAIYGEHAAWRYALISGVIPAVPLIIIRPFLPESPAWQAKKAQGTLRRPSFVELFQPTFRRTTMVSAALFACSFGVAFGAIQWTPQIVPGLVLSKEEQAKSRDLRKEYEAAKAEDPRAPRVQTLKKQLAEIQNKAQEVVPVVQYFQEVGGLLGRFALAWLAIRIVGRRKLLRLFLLPGLVVVPLVYLIPAAGNLPSHNVDVLKVGIFVAGFLTIAQFSFWGNYLPRVYPLHLRGTGEGFSANVGGRMVGTAANPLTAFVAAWIFAAPAVTQPSVRLAYAAAAVAFLIYALSLILSFWLPEPMEEALLE